jgi:hypothetical protein
MSSRSLADEQWPFLIFAIATHEQDLTGKNRERGTLIPMALSKC